MTDPLARQNGRCISCFAKQEHEADPEDVFGRSIGKQGTLLSGGVEREGEKNFLIQDEKPLFVNSFCFLSWRFLLVGERFLLSLLQRSGVGCSGVAEE